MFDAFQSRIASSYVNRLLQLTRLLHRHVAESGPISSEIEQALNGATAEVARLNEAMVRVESQNGLLVALAERDRQFFETINAGIIGHAANLRQLLDQEIQQLSTHIVDINSRLDRMEFHVARSSLAARGEAGRARVVAEGAVAVPATQALLPIDQQMERLQQAAPAAFDLWIDAFEAGLKAYEEEREQEASLSIAGNEVAERFGEFILAQGGGPLLDVGCGPQRTPSYLLDYPRHAVVGIDPLGVAEDHDFAFAPSLGEFLPFANESFQTVVSGTSLDHALLLDETFAEIARVLRPSGRFLAWIGTTPGAAPYDPRAASVARLDAFHLFHFSCETFELAVRPHFTITEKLSVDHNHWFYALRKI